MKKTVFILVAGAVMAIALCGCNAGNESSLAGTTTTSVTTTKATEDTSENIGDKISSAIDEGMDDLSSAIENATS